MRPVEIAGVILLGALWIVVPGWTLLGIGGAIGLLAVLAWGARRIGI